MEVTPALYGAYLANEAEKAAPENTLVECLMIGASGRVYMAGKPEGLAKARAAVEAGLKDIAKAMKAK